MHSLILTSFLWAQRYYGIPLYDNPGLVQELADIYQDVGSQVALSNAEKHNELLERQKVQLKHFLEQWDVERFEFVLNSLKYSPWIERAWNEIQAFRSGKVRVEVDAVEIQTLRALLGRRESRINEIAAESEKLTDIRDVAQLRRLLREKADLISDILYLTPSEIKGIVQNEIERGNLYWDSYVDIFPFLLLTFTNARNLQRQLNETGSYTTSGEIQGLLDFKEQCIEELAYGGRDLNSMRTLVQRIRHVGQEKQSYEMFVDR